MKTLVNSLIISAILTPFFLMGNAVYQVQFFESSWEEQPTADCLIILGARTLPGNIPGLMLGERLETALQVIDDDIEHVIVTGGTIDDNNDPEALVMKDVLVEGGVDESKIISEEKSTSTYENLVYSKPIIESTGCEQVDILSHDFHLGRVKLTARKLEIPVNRLIPAQNAKPSSRERLSREYLAYLWYWLIY